MTIPASIRSNNPGAMWGNKLATKWGATKSEVLHDGLGQGNNIAYFPTKFQGACAQIDLWRTNYVNMTFAAADKKWSGGNSDAAYVSFLCKHVPGLTPNTKITTAFLQSESGWQMMKYQAQWEAGQVYPDMTDMDWQRAQMTVFSKGTVTHTQKKAAAVVVPVVAAAPVVAHAVSTGNHFAMIAGVVAGIVVAVIALIYFHAKSSEGSKPVGTPAPTPTPTPNVEPPTPTITTPMNPNPDSTNPDSTNPKV